MLCKEFLFLALVTILSSRAKLVEGLTRNVMINCKKLFPILTSSSGGDYILNITYLELWRQSWLAERNRII